MMNITVSSNHQSDVLTATRKDGETGGLISSHSKAESTVHVKGGGVGILDSRYYFKDGDIHLESEGTIFRVHADKIEILGGLFRGLSSQSQPAGVEAGRTSVRPLYGTQADEVRYLIGYAYDEIQLTSEELPWKAAVALLRLSYMFDLVDLRRRVVTALGKLFPSTGITRQYPKITGIKKDQRELFVRCFPIEAVNLFKKHGLSAFMPVAYYRAAQLSVQDIVSGVVDSNGTRISLAQDDVINVLQGRERLQQSRRTILYKYFNEFTVDGLPEAPTPKCFHRASLEGETCFDYLLRLVLDLNRCGFMDARPDGLQIFLATADSSLKARLCDSCYTNVKYRLMLGLRDNWRLLPSYFQLKSWKDVVGKGNKNN